MGTPKMNVTQFIAIFPFLLWFGTEPTNHQGGPVLVISHICVSSLRSHFHLWSLSLGVSPLLVMPNLSFIPSFIVTYFVK